MIDKQQYAIQKIKQGYSLFLTGSGGVGKSWVIQQVTDANTVLCAPTGIAALNIGGTTCHKLFGLPIGLPIQKDYNIISRKCRELFSGDNIKRIIIDEVGMLRADYLELIDHKLRKIRFNDLPFGGIQMIMVGDFFQLEPIISWNEKEHFYQKYDSPFCFSSNCWNFEHIELEKVYRQSDERQVSILNSIRKKDKWYKLALQRIVEESTPYINNENILHLCCYKQDANTINDYWYNQIKETEHIYSATWSGEWYDEPVDKQIILKKGCKVIICANDLNNTYQNGERGTVYELHKNSIRVVLENGREVVVCRNKWEKYKYTKTRTELNKEVESTFEQFPLRLGWAITVHKSQGMTLDNVALDIGKGCFSHGQLYVALSRVKDLRNLSIISPIHPDNVIVRDEVIEFYGNI